MTDWTKLTDKPSALEIYKACKDWEKRRTRAITRAYILLKSNAKRRKIPFELSPADFASVWRDDCALCGAKFSKVSGRWTSRSTDRIDASIGYVLSNVRQICFAENAMIALQEARVKKAKKFEPFL
jgi:hypothetical protein